MQSEDASGEGNTIVKGDHNTTLIAQPGAIVLYNNPQIRREIAKVVQPLRKDGIESLEVREGGQITRLASGDDVRYFTVEPGGSSPDADSGEFVDWVSVRKLWVTPKNRKWQFALSNGSPFNAEITDERFWQDLEAGRYNLSSPHAKLHARIEWRETNGEFNYTIVEVLGHLRPEPYPQPDLPMPPDPAES